MWFEGCGHRGMKTWFLLCLPALEPKPSRKVFGNQNGWKAEPAKQRVQLCSRRRVREESESRRARKQVRVEVRPLATREPQKSRLTLSRQDSIGEAGEAPLHFGVVGHGRKGQEFILWLPAILTLTRSKLVARDSALHSIRLSPTPSEMPWDSHLLHHLPPERWQGHHA